MNIIEAKKKARQLAAERRKIAFHLVEFDITPDISKLSEPFEYLAFYMPMRTELNCLPTMRSIYEKGKKILVPIIQKENSPLEFYEWKPDAKMVEGKFGALIPQGVKSASPQIVFAPLLAFDESGTRLGYGGGFYDRTLANLRAKNPTPYVGLAFNAQKSETRLPKESTDIQLDAVITENGIHSFPKKS